MAGTNPVRPYHAPYRITARPEDRGPAVDEKQGNYSPIRCRDPRSAIIAEAARDVAAENPRLDVHTIASERGYLTSLMMERLASMVLEARGLAWKTAKRTIAVVGGSAVLVTLAKAIARAAM